MDSDIKFDSPTFILAECVLVYMELHSGKVLLKFFSEKFSTAIFVNYEQVSIKMYQVLKFKNAKNQKE